MKTKMLLAVLVATALSSMSIVQAGEPVFSPRASENRIRIVSDNSTDADLVHSQTATGNAARSKNMRSVVVAAGSQKNADTLAMDKNCPLSPKAKDGSLACKKCCMTTAMK